MSFNIQATVMRKQTHPAAIIQQAMQQLSSFNINQQQNNI
jgi:hypothetical protein